MRDACLHYKLTFSSGELKSLIFSINSSQLNLIWFKIKTKLPGVKFTCLEVYFFSQFNKFYSEQVGSS